MSPPGSVQDAPPAGDDDVDVLERAVQAGRDVMRQSAQAVAAAADRFPGFEAALSLLLHARGRVVVTGLGKSGLIARKIAATLASTGTPSLFVHAADALHGDAGMAAPGDAVLALSNSGETVEVVQFARMVKSRGIPVIAMTGCDGRSTLSGLADVLLDAGVARECDPWNLVPTASTTVSLVIGDALAISLMVARNLGPEDFQRHHPGGSLGKRRDHAQD